MQLGLLALNSSRAVEEARMLGGGSTSCGHDAIFSVKRREAAEVTDAGYS